jgi:hypothetical protein
VRRSHAGAGISLDNGDGGDMDDFAGIRMPGVIKRHMSQPQECVLCFGRVERVAQLAPDLEALERAARVRVSRSLTDAECRQYLHLDACP